MKSIKCELRLFKIHLSYPQVKYNSINNVSLMYDNSIMVSRANKKFAIFAACIIGLLYLAFFGGFERISRCGNVPTISRKTSVVTKDGTMYEYDRQSHIVFIGGVPRSGTT